MINASAARKVQRMPGASRSSASRFRVAVVKKMEDQKCVDAPARGFQYAAVGRGVGDCV